MGVWFGALLLCYFNVWLRTTVYRRFIFISLLLGLGDCRSKPRSALQGSNSGPINQKVWSFNLFTFIFLAFIIIYLNYIVVKDKRKLLSWFFLVFFLCPNFVLLSENTGFNYILTIANVKKLTIFFLQFC